MEYFRTHRQRKRGIRQNTRRECEDWNRCVTVPRPFFTYSLILPPPSASPSHVDACTPSIRCCDIPSILLSLSLSGLRRAVRLAAFRLVQAGLEPKPGIETLLNILRMASKTGLSLSGAHSLSFAVDFLLTICLSPKREETPQKQGASSPVLRNTKSRCARSVQKTQKRKMVCI